MASDISISIGAKDNATSVLSSVMNKVGSLASSFAAFGPVVAGLGTAIAGAVAGFASISVAASAANSIDALSDKARGLGESVGSLQEFQFALAEAGNVSGEQAIATLEKLSASVGKIATGKDKEGLEVFKKLGLDANELSLEGPIAQFEAIQNKLSEVSNNSERAALAQQLFGKAAKDLLPALSTQAASMRESQEYARQVGAAIGDDGASAVAAMNDAIGRVGLGLQGIANTAAVELAPAVQSVATYIATWIPPIVELANEWLPYIIDSMAYVADSALEAARAFGLMSGNTTWADSIAKAREQAKATADELEAMRASMQAINRVGDEPVDATKFDGVIDALERQLQVAIHGEEAVKAQEQVLLGRNELEQERIRLLQEQVSEQLRFNEAAKLKKEEDKKAEKEREQMAAKIAAVPKSTGAFESRVMSRGPGSDPMLAELKKSNDEAKQATKLLRDIYEESKKRSKVLEVELVQ
jgi:hypothetical protein